jgi:uncharacterized protein Yka (UPF0111/DUF47 family)
MRLLPRDEKFFGFFSAVATIAVESASLLQELLRADAQRRAAIVDQIKRLEHQADQVTHEVVTRLDRSIGRTFTFWLPGWTTSSTSSTAPPDGC